MINTEFFLKDEIIVGFSLSGHAEYADFGQDIVCAAVSSALEMTANAITEILKLSADVKVINNRVTLMLPKDDGSLKYEKAIDFLKAFRLHMELLSQDYTENIRLTDMEV